MRRVEGEILKLRCDACRMAFPTMEFSGDTDMATWGLASATSSSGDVLVVGEMTADEYGVGYAAGFDRFAERVTRQQGSVFKAAHLLRSEVDQSVAQGSDFSEFRRSYFAPTLIFGCLACGGDARVVGRESGQDFQHHGGKLTVLGELTIS
jgi:hypothetical protein